MDTLGQHIVDAARQAADQLGVTLRYWAPGKPKKPPAVQWRYEAVNPDGRRRIRIWVWWNVADPTETDSDLVSYLVTLHDLLRLRFVEPTGWVPLRNQNPTIYRSAAQSVKGLAVDGMTSVWTEP